MRNLFEDDYSLERLERIKVKQYGFELFVTPRLASHYTSKLYEAMTAFIVNERVRNAHTFIDVGAHYGFFSVLAGLANPACRILAFEPIPENFEILKKNMELNGILNAQLFQTAVSNREEKAEFQVSAASDNSGFIANPAAPVLKNIDVEVIRLDQFIDRIPNKPTLLKIDTEGSEIQVLQGMEKLIQQVDDLEIIIEFNQRCLIRNGVDPEELLKVIIRVGFSINFIHDENGKCEHYDGSRHWKNYMNGNNYKNLYCVKKNSTTKKRVDARYLKPNPREKASFPPAGSADKKITKANIKRQEQQNVRKILFVNHNLPPYELSGTPLSTLNHALGMKSRGLDVAVLIPDYTVKDGITKDLLCGIPVYKIPKLDREETFLLRVPAAKLLPYQRMINHVLEDFRPDIVHINDYVFMPSDIIPFFSRTGVPVVRNICNAEEICYRIEPVIHSGRSVNLCAGPTDMERCAACYSRARRFTLAGSAESIKTKLIERQKLLRDIYDTEVSAVIFTTSEFSDYFTSFVPISKEKIHIIPRGFNFGHDRPRYPVKISGKVVKFGFIGSGSPTKGIDVLLRALDTLVHKDGFELHIYGNIGHRHFVHWIDELKKKNVNAIYCHGTFTPDDLSKIASELHCAIVPSHFDTYNRTVREMLWSGVPLIVTDFFGSSIIEEGFNGRRILRGDSGALADRLSRMIENPGMIETLSEGALRTPIPSLDDEIEGLLNVYQHLYTSSQRYPVARPQQQYEVCEEADSKRRNGMPTQAVIEAYQGIQQVLIQTGQHAEALFALEKLIATCRGYAPAHHDLGILYYERQDKEKALFHLDRAAQLEPFEIRFIKDLADMYLADLGNVEEALKLYNHALTLQPDDIDTLLRIGNICAAQKQFDQARFFYDRVLFIDSGNDQAKENISFLQRMAKDRSLNGGPEAVADERSIPTCNPSPPSSEEPGTIDTNRRF